MVAATTAAAKEAATTTTTTTTTPSTPLEKLLQRLSRQFSAHVSCPRPPDAAAAALGRELGRHVVSLQSQSSPHQQQQDLDLLWRALARAADGMPPSVPYAFFNEIINERRKQNRDNNINSNSNMNYALVLSSFEWIPRWILQTEEAIQKKNSNNSSGLRHLLDASIRAYAFYLVTTQQQQLLLLSSRSIEQHQQQQRHLNNSHHLQEQQMQQAVLDVYHRLQLDSSRRYLLRAAIEVAFQDEENDDIGLTVPIVLTPFLVVSVLLQTTSSNNNNDGTAALALFFRNLWSAWTRPTVSQDDCFCLLEWMTDALSILLDVSTTLTTTSSTSSNSTSALEEDSRSAALGLAESWLVELLFLAQALHRRQQASQKHQQQQQQDLLDDWLATVLYKTLPRIVGVCCCYHEPSPVLQGLTDVVVSISSSSPARCFQLDASTALRLAVTTLMTANADDRVQLLDLLRNDGNDSNDVEEGNPLLLRPDNQVALSMLESAACISAQDEGCHASAIKLYEKLQSCRILMDKNKNKDQDSLHYYAGDNTSNLIQLLERQQQRGGYNSNSNNRLIDGIAVMCHFRNAKLSAAQQIAAMLFGIFLLDRDDKQGRDENRGFSFLSNLLLHAPHLGISLLPIILERIHRASSSHDGKRLLRCLDFLCTSLARDSHCAQEIWFYVGGTMMQPDVPLPVRVAVIRLFPRLCNANKRLYRRVMDSLETALMSRQPEIRLAVAATLADLAEKDQIRDVSDVIGWLQGLLTEERFLPVHTLLVHCAIMSLHYLVIAQELDFDVVVKVLNKRLCSVADFEAVLQLPAPIQEALVLLLGDGECDDGDSSSDDDKGKRETPSVVTVSLQVSRAVGTLVRLGASLLERSRIDVNQAKVLENIFISLSGYSLDALGLTEDGIEAVVSSLESVDDVDEPQALPEAGKRYIALRDLVVKGLKLPFVESKQASDDPRVRLARKMLEFEEESLGSSLWKKRGVRNQTKATLKTGKQTQLSDMVNMLPDPTEVQELATARASPSSAIAMILSFDGSQEKLSMIRDNGDASLESSDPFFVVLSLQAYLRAAMCMAAKTPHNEIGNVIAEIRSWYQVFVSPDTMYLAISALSIYIPHDLREEASSKSSFVEDIFSVVMEAFKSNRFEKEVIGKICLGLVAVSSLRSGSIEKAVDIVTTLDQSVRAYGGQKCFGAYYGLAIVCQALQHYIACGILEHVLDDVKRTIFRICGFLIEELLSCYEERSDIFDALVDCLKSGFATSGLVESMSDLDVSSISLLMTKHVTARYLFISCAVCLPGLSVLNGALHLATLRMLEAFEWGGGKGIILPPMLRACQESNLFEAEELNQIYTTFVQTFEDRMGGGAAGIDSEGLDDIFYALNGMSTKQSSYLIRRTLVGNQDLFDDDGCVLSLIAMVISVIRIPCLGASFFLVLPEFRVDANSSALESTVKIVRESVMTGGDSKFSRMGMILLALLSSMRHQQELNAAIAPHINVETKSPPVKKPEDSLLDFEKIPTPRPGTVLAGLLQEIEVQVESKSAKDEVYLTRGLSSLECLSLPDQLAKSFLEPLMQLFGGPVVLSCVSLLCSQVRGRRRAVFSGSEFITSALSLANYDYQQWSELSGEECLKVFVDSLPETMKKLSPDTTERALVNVWSSCLAMLSRGSRLVVSFLSSVRQLIESTALSPKTVNAVRLVIGRASKDLLEYPLGMLTSKMPNDSSPSILESFVLCLQKMPKEVFDEDDYVNIVQTLDDFDSEVVKVLTLTSLIDHGYFSSAAQGTVELSRVGSWISKKIQLPNEQVDSSALRQVIISFATVTSKDSSATKKDRLSSLLEMLLLTKEAASKIGFEWLAVMMAHWCERSGSDAEITLGFLCIGASDLPRTLTAPDLEDYFQVLLEDLPHNLACFSSREKISALVCNQLHRLLEHWTEQNVDSDILDFIRKTIFSCQRNLPNDDSLFAKLASSTLTSQQFNVSVAETGMSDIDKSTH